MTLKAYSAEDRTVEKAKNFAYEYYDKRMQRNMIHSFMNAVFSTLSNFGLILAVVWCGISVLNGNDDYGSILSVILLLMQLQHPFASFSSIIPAYYSRITSGERLAEIEDMPTEKSLIVNNSIHEVYADLKKITLNNLSFTYGRNIILDNVNYQIEKGKIICLKGASGVGKSTIFKLLLNVYKPTDGTIYLQSTEDNKPLTEENRNLFAYVPQGHFLFSGTIYENLTFFSNEKDEQILQEKIQQAIKTACADFVWELPDKLQTLLTEGGGGLSEGQLQRLAVARAILSERPILLLDEATSALDNETEKTLLENVRQLENKTCLIVTHRAAALDIANEIISIQDGKIIKIK